MFAVRHYPRLVTEALRAWLRPFVRYDADGRGSVWLENAPKPPRPLPLLLANVANVVAPDVVWSGVLLQCYRDGQAVTPCHSDPGGGFILSIGAPRTFSIHRIADGCGNHSISIECVEGTVLLMDEDFQRHWHHQIVPDPDVTGEKLSLVFRTQPGTGNTPT